MKEPGLKPCPMCGRSDIDLICPENNLPVEGSHSSIVIKDLDYYDKYIDGYGLYDKIRNRMDHND